jgi:organic hydroperoxide reductase OsmC/OhrA
MATHTADIRWTLKEGDDVAKGRFSRGHDLSFDGGLTIPGSASPHVVGKWAVEAAVDPEEMLVAALSSCHMLSFLHVARLAGFAVASYADHAEGVTGDIAPGRMAVTKVVLHPRIEWTGSAPDKEKLDHLHHQAHDICFIANSVTTRVTIE